MREAGYAPGNSRKIDTRQLVVVSGCSGGGKSSLLDEMSNRGYPIRPEPGRQIVKEQLHVGGEALPWVDARRFAELCISRSMMFYNVSGTGGRPTLFDRCIIDNALGLLREGYEIPKYVKTAISSYRYRRDVFLVPPWRELFTNDNERRHTFKDAVAEYSELLAGYESFGYRTVVIPKGSVRDRADFLEERLRESDSQTGRTAW